MSILVIGGTGTLGRQIVKQALDEGYQVKCLVRDFRRGAFLKDWGAELIYGDLSIPSTIPTALKGVNTIIDSATIRSTSSYTSEAIDWRGKLLENGERWLYVWQAGLARRKRETTSSLQGWRCAKEIGILLTT